MSDDKNVRHRFTVPAADTVVNEWIESQSNLGFSLRTLIKAFVKTYGYQDATCLEFGEPIKKRGRPPKQMKIKYDRMNDEQTNDIDLQSAVQQETRVTDVLSNVSESVTEQSAIVTKDTVEFEQSERNAIDDILGHMNDMVPSKPTASSQEDYEPDADEDGFVDPESLF